MSCWEYGVAADVREVFGFWNWSGRSCCREIVKKNVFGLRV